MIALVVVSSTRDNCDLCRSYGRVSMRGVDWPEDATRDIPCPHCNPPQHPLLYLPHLKDKP